MGQNGTLHVPGRKPLIKPLSTLKLDNVKLTHRCTAAVMEVRESGKKRAVLVLEDAGWAYLISSKDQVLALRDALDRISEVVDE